MTREPGVSIQRAGGDYGLRVTGDKTAGATEGGDNNFH